MALLAGIEAGGTKFVCVIGEDPDHILKRTQIPTTSPEETLQGALDFFVAAAREFGEGQIDAMGIGSFGPVDLRPGSETRGFITNTPKPGWQNTDICGYFARKLGIPVDFETDVNASALGEGYAGAGRGLSTFMYITVGTGIGGGIIVNGRPIHGLLHPEAGHILLRPRNGDNFPGNCPFHGSCLEGFCSGPAIEKRWGMRADQLDPEHEAWDIEAYYLAQALMAYVLTISPECIIIGGGVMSQQQLFPKIRSYLKNFLNGYVAAPAILEGQEHFITPPHLGDRSGIIGTLVMARNIHSSDKGRK